MNPETPDDGELSPQEEMVTRIGILQKLKGNPATGFPNVDEDTFHYAFNAVWQINDDYRLS